MCGLSIKSIRLKDKQQKHICFCLNQGKDVRKMSNIEIVKVLLKHIGEDLSQDKAIAAGCITILDATDPKPAVAASRQKATDADAPEKPAASKPAAKREKFDTGKMKALLQGGWSIPKIADEMGVSDQTVRNHMKREGYK